MVRVIFVDTTLPVRMRPRMETSPVKGHFLSVTIQIWGFLSLADEHTDICAINGFRRRLEP